MKLKGLTKLALSGVALAAVAATLGTSTYAWYVSNSTATVDGIDGATAASTSGNLLVSQVTVGSNEGVIEEAGSAWGNNLASVSAKQTPELNPVSKDITGHTPVEVEDPDTHVKSNTPTGWHNKDLGAVAKSSAYGYYAFAIYSTDKVKADMKVGVENTTTDANFKFQTAYSTTGLNATNTGIGIFESFTTDFLQAMRVEIFQAPLLTGDDALTLNQIFTATTTTTGENPVTTLTYRVGIYCPADTFYQPGFGAAYDTRTISGKKFVTGGDAHAYYHAVLGEDPAGSVTPEALNTLTNGVKELNLAKADDGSAQKYIIVFRYWLEGGDTDCFDSCGGQNFGINLEFGAKN